MIDYTLQEALEDLIRAGWNGGSDDAAYDFINTVLDNAVVKIESRCHKGSHFVSNDKPYLCKNCKEITDLIRYDIS